MKSIKDIIESSFSNSVNRYEKHGTPDKLTNKIDGYSVTHYWDDYDAVPFIYNKKLNKILWGFNSDSHFDMIQSLSPRAKTEIGLPKNVDCASDLRWDWFEDYETDEDAQEAIDKWNDEHPYASDFYLGRLWHHNYSKEPDDNLPWVAYIVWWNELTSSEFTKFNNIIISAYNKRTDNKKEDREGEPEITKYYAIDNNGDIKEMDVNNNETKYIDKRSKDSKEIIKKARNIHTATQDEKRKYFELFRKARAEKMQNELYNKTKSKTAAEFHNNKTKRYDPITGKMVWGEKIGDSLQTTHLKDYVINEFHK